MSYDPIPEVPKPKTSWKGKQLDWALPSAKHFRKRTKLKSAFLQIQTQNAMLVQLANFTKLFKLTLDIFGNESNWMTRVKHKDSCGVVKWDNGECYCAPETEVLWAGEEEPIEIVKKAFEPWEKVHKAAVDNNGGSPDGQEGPSGLVDLSGGTRSREGPSPVSPEQVDTDQPIPSK